MMYYNKTIQETLDLLEVNEQGLTSSQVKKRQELYGYNELEQVKKESLFLRFINQFKDLMIIILIVAAIVSIITDPTDWIDSFIIFIVVILNAVIGLAMESQAEKSLDSLNKLSAPQCKVIRDHTTKIISSRELTIGDIILIEAGDMIPSDARLLEAYNLKTDESSLTGESLPVEKTTDCINHEAVIGDWANMLFSSTVCTYGRGKAVVTSIGMDNQVGKIADMLLSHKKEKTPLQVKLDEIGKVIGVLCILICILVFIMEVMNHESPLQSFETAIALAVAAIPEGLSATVTIVLALSVTKLVKQNAIIRKLPAVETLGSTSIVCSDKTGTLTQNKMTVVKTCLNGEDIKDFSTDDPKTNEMLNYFTLCNDAKIEDGKEIGDPTEIALVEASMKAGYYRRQLDHNYPRIEEIAFDSDRKMMSVIVKNDQGFLSITKGGPDVVLSHCINVDISQAMAINDQMANKALRVLAVAIKQYDDFPSSVRADEIEEHMTFVGFIGMIDPSRPEAKDAIALASLAGVRTIMITGDHKTTASAIAKDLGILHEKEKVISGMELSEMSQEDLENHIEDYSVYARVAPEHKVRIVKAWQSKDKIVAMTGDGVNDAPALKTADIGCAMGITGTDVSKNAATMILTDDNFATIISAIRQGRGIFDNIQKDVQYLLSSNVGEVLTIFIASFIALMNPSLGYGVPLLPIHLLWVNLITDTLPAFALGLEPVEKDIMKRKPREKKESFFSHGLLIKILLQGCMVGALTLLSYSFGLGISHAAGQTMAFITLSGSQIAHSFNVKSHHTIFNKTVFNNKYLWASAVAGILLQAIIIITPLSKIFKLEVLNIECLLIALVCALAVIPIVEISKLIAKNKA